MNFQRRVFLAAVGLLFAATAQAHHTYVTKYDPGKYRTLRGIVTFVRYENPHIFFGLRVRGSTGEVEWTVETEGIPKAQARGLTQERLKAGAMVKVDGWLARDGTASFGMKSITLPGGKVVTMRNTAR